MQGSVLISSRKSVVGKSWKDSQLEYRMAVQHSGWEYWLQCQRPGFKSYFNSLTARYRGYNSEEGKLLGPHPYSVDGAKRSQECLHYPSDICNASMRRKRLIFLLIDRYFIF